MGNKIIYISIFILFSFSCKENTQINIETPFMSVVKLKSAEQHLSFDKAKIYIDLDSVYSKYSKDIDPEEEWIKLLRFYHNLAKDPKFTNNFHYYDYDIEEKITGKKAIVTLSEKDSTRKIVYTLNLRNDRWVVVGIDYVGFVE